MSTARGCGAFMALGCGDVTGGGSCAFEEPGECESGDGEVEFACGDNTAAIVANYLECACSFCVVVYWSCHCRPNALPSRATRDRVVTKLGVTIR